MKIAILPMLLAGTLLAASPTSSGTAWPSPAFDQVVVPVGGGPASVAIADVNHDGKLDILVANTTSATIDVLLGDGRGHFQRSTGSPFPAGPSPNDIALGDFNGDGHLDMVIANTGTPYLTILLGNGRGGFAPSPHSPFATQSYPHTHGVVAADFSGTGHLDVITDSWGHDQILMLHGDGHGNLLTPGQLFHVGKRPYQRLRAADFNQDGKPDVVTTDLDDNTVTILLGDGTGGFRAAAGSPFPAGAAPWAVAIDDINKDGHLDLITVPYAPDVKDPTQVGVTVLFGDGRGGFTTMRGSPLSLAGCQGPDRVAAGDLNGDGLRDIVVSCGQSNNLILFMGSRDGSFHAVMHEVKDLGWSGVAVADLNGDGKDDIVVSNNGAGTVTILVSR